MSIFGSDLSNIKTTISFFNSLTPQEKASIVADLGYVYDHNELLNRMLPILDAIRNDISKHHETTIGDKLFQLGMEEAYARLLVSAVIKQAPTVQYEISILAKISDKNFQENIPNIMNDMWIKQISLDELAKKYDVTVDFIQCFGDFSSNYMNQLQRRSISDDYVKQLCSENGLSDASVDVLVNTFHKYADFWYKMVTFTNIQDAVAELDMLRRENKHMLDAIKELTELVKHRDQSDHNRFQ